MNADLPVQRAKALDGYNHLAPLSIAVSRILLRAVLVSSVGRAAPCSSLSSPGPADTAGARTMQGFWPLPPSCLSFYPPGKNQTETLSLVVQYLGKDSGIVSISICRLITHDPYRHIESNHIRHGPECGSWEAHGFVSL